MHDEAWQLQYTFIIYGFSNMTADNDRIPYVCFCGPDGNIDKYFHMIEHLAWLWIELT